MLEVRPFRPQVGPQLVVEEAVADGGADDDAPVAHHPLEAQHLGAQRLHHHDGVGAHAVAVVELLGHAEHQHVVLLLRPVHVGALVGDLPALGHHLGGVAGVDGDLAALGVQNSVAAEEGMAHLLLHQHADLVELVAHQAAAVHGGEVIAMHDLGHMVAGDAAPVGDAGGAVLVAAGVAAVGVALHMADEDGQVRLEDGLVHPHRVAPLGEPQVDHVVRVLGVVAGHLVGGPELPEQLLTEDGLVVLGLRAGVQAVGDDELDVLLLHARGIQLFQDEPDAHLAVAGGLLAALDPVGHDEHHLRAGEGQLAQGLHADGMAQALEVGLLQLVLGDAGRVRHGGAGDEHIGVVGQLGAHQAVAVFKIQFHSRFLLVLWPGLIRPGTFG